MPTAWDHQVYCVCTLSAMPGAIAALDIAFPCDDGEPRDATKPENYGCKLSSNGELPETHYGSAFSVTEPIRAALEGLGLAATPGVTYWRCDADSGLLSATNHPESQAVIGQPWDWQKCLELVGLMPVVLEIEK